MYLLILGANSDVAQAVAKKFAKEEHANLYLASRDMETLKKTSQDIAIRHQVEARPLYFDATDYDSHTDFYDSLNPRPDGVVVAFGYLGNQQRAQNDFQEARKIIETNYLGAVSIIEIIAADFERRRHGFIIGISSVAGQRGRQSNYMYGSAKGGFTTYLSGLRSRLHKSNIAVMTVLPGFIKTKMTDQLSLPPILTSTPTKVADVIYRSYKGKKHIIYTAKIWKYIMIIIRTVPERIFIKLSI